MAMKNNERNNAVLSKIEDGEVFIDCDGFIIPNAIKSESNFLSDYVRSEFHKYVINTCCDNFIATKSTYDVSDVKFVEMWFSAVSTAASENMVDHGFYILDENGEKQYCRLAPMSQFIPVRLVMNNKEGDHIPVKLRAKYCELYYNEDPNDNTKDINVTLNIRLSQTKYRYRDFGNFEEALSKLLK